MDRGLAALISYDNFLPQLPDHGLTGRLQQGLSATTNKSRFLVSHQLCPSHLRQETHRQCGFDIVFTLQAIEDLRLLKKGERTRIIEAIEDQLSYEPNNETRNRKRLRPNQTAE